MTNGWQENISTWLIWLWLNCKFNVVTIISYKFAKSIEGFTETIKSNVGILCAIWFSTFTAAPTHVRSCAKFNCKFDIFHNLANCIATDIFVIWCKCAIFENRMCKQICCRHRHLHASFSQRLLEAINVSTASALITSKWDQVIIMKGHTVCATGS